MAGYDGQVTLPGYDNMSGIGSPSGQAFISALRAREKYPSRPLPGPAGPGSGASRSREEHLLGAG
jgi:hypothetical protein